MDWIDTPNSSNIQKFGYSDEEMKLYVIFKNNNTYVYENVPKAYFENMINADSVGRYLNIAIKPLFKCQNLSVYTKDQYNA